MFRSPGDFDSVTLVLLSSVFASTVNAILIGLVLCTFSTLMLLLIKCKTTLACVIRGLFGRGQRAQNKMLERDGAAVCLNNVSWNEQCLVNTSMIDAISSIITFIL